MERTSTKKGGNQEGKIVSFKAALTALSSEGGSTRHGVIQCQLGSQASWRRAASRLFWCS